MGQFASGMDSESPTIKTLIGVQEAANADTTLLM